MTLEVAIVLLILGAALVLFVTEALRMDVVALLVLAALALTRLVTPAEALSGFSNPAVVTVWAMFMISAGLSRTGVAGLLGEQVLRVAGRGEVRMILVIMLTSAVLSAFMNNIGVAALMLPVVMDIARRTGKAPSRLLMPLAYGSLLGGLTTLIGTPPNLLVSDALREQGLTPFRLFDFAPVGGVAMTGGILFVALVGRHFLPRLHPARGALPEDAPSLREQYGLLERTAALRLPAESVLVGKTLRESRIGSATGLNVLAIVRGGELARAPSAESVLRAGDRLLVEGRLDRFNELQGWRELVVEPEAPALGGLVSDDVAVAELRLPPESPLIGESLGAIRFRHRFGGIVLAIRRDGTIIDYDLADSRLAPRDRLLVQGRRARLEQLRASAEFGEFAWVSEETLRRVYRLGERLFAVRVPADSILVGKTLVESRIGDAIGLGVVGLVRGGVTHMAPEPDERLQPEDRLLLRGERAELDVLRGLQQLEIESGTPPEFAELESERIGLVEAILSPRTALAGRSLRDLGFREKFGLQVLAILREGRSLRSNLRDLTLRFGDALLLFGPRDNLMRLAREPDFLVLTQAAQEAPRSHKAPLALAIMAGFLAPVLLGWIPIAIGAVAGAALMVAVGCLSMEEAHRAIEWRSIFLIAGLLPLGVAMQESGAASLLAEQVLATAGRFGPWGVVVGLYLVTAGATLIIPTAALVVLMAPIALGAAADLGVSPYTVMMAVAIAASASFASPISHPANLLVMGPGGYRFVDYLKLGLPLTLVVMLIALSLLTLVWPL